ncbi:MAG TPA: T9SS type A sorting domain-containing protein, partial [Candidatus Kapabacteria bacterium]|nr:T9SS type A sorting domain-containing protein [Candidatus Kapabacteria bacterium]
DVNGYGQNMACPSEPAVQQIVHDQITRVRDLHQVPNKYMIGHDEIRHLNWDHSCQSRELTPAEILAGNVSLTKAQIESVSSGNSVYAWSDMFDSLHNAHDNFYAVNGDLTGVWNMIPKDITIVNWNSQKKDESLAFFAKHGFSQMSAPYYDQGNTVNMREWRQAQQGVPNIKGMMYTTWSADYSHLRPFGYYAWGAGPYIMHKPLDSLSAATTSVIRAEVTPDPFDAADRITNVRAVYTLRSDGSLDSVDLIAGASKTYQRNIPLALSSYKLVAVDQQGLIRETPTYLYASGPLSVAPEISDVSLALYPNPTADLLVVREGAIVRVLSLSGAEMMLAEEGATTLNVSSLAAGAYLAEIRSDDGSVRTVKFVRQ